MESKIVAISIDKVQTFLYYAIHAHVQEKQTNSGTLRSIMESSNLISKRFYEKVGFTGTQGVFAGKIDQVLLQCSGVCIFSTSLENEQIAERLKDLFRYYYTNFNGQLLMKYVSFRHKISFGNDKLDAITKAKAALKHPSCLNHIIEENQELLFEFQTSPDESINMEPEKSAIFVSTINDLCPPQTMEKEPSHFRIAIIKADIDGMGHLFQSIESFEDYQSVSNILSQQINIDALGEEVRKIQAENKEFRVYPLYAAGDDILFAVELSQIGHAVHLCEQIWRNVNGKISKPQATSPSLSMSIGVDITFNREPIRYYYERVEKQLEQAKAALNPWCSTTKDHVPCIKICVNQYVLYQYPIDIIQSEDIKKLKKDTAYPCWSHFLHSVKLLKQANTNGLHTHHMLYGLLEKLMDPTIRGDELTCSNAILYHFLPQFLDSPNKNLRESELLLLETLMNQITVKETVNGRPIRNLQFKEEQLKRLEAVVRLLLLFTDSRFDLMVQGKTEDFHEHIKNVRSTVFNRPLRYLYETSLVGSNNDMKKATALRDLFVKQERYKIADPNGNKRSSFNKVQVYRTLPIGSSMLFRLKDKAEKTGMVANMIKAVLTMSEEEHDGLVRERKKNYQAPPALRFDDRAFRIESLSTNLWGKDFLDALIIFYRCKDSLIRFRKQYPISK